MGIVLLAVSDETSAEPVNVTINSLADKNDKLVQFLVRVMTDYPDWLSTQSVDPTEPIPGPFDLHSEDWSSSKVKLNLTVRNVYMEGYSNSDLYEYIEVDARFTRDRVDFRYLEADIHTVGVTFGGDYVANGTVTDKDEETGETFQIEFSGSGKWKIKTDEMMLSSRYTNFMFLEDDRFDFAGKLPSVSSVPYASSENVDFEGILEGNDLLKPYEDDIKTELKRVYTWTLWNAERNPSAKLFSNFAENFRGFYGFSFV